MSLTESDLRFQRIKHLLSSRKTKLKFEASTGVVEDDVYSVTTDELPAPEFFQALDHLKPHVADVLEWRQSYVEDVTILGVTFSHYADAPDEIVVTGLKEVATDLNFISNTPAVPPNASTIDVLDRIRHEAKRFLDGKRSQADLFDDTDDEKPSPAELAEQAADHTN